MFAIIAQVDIWMRLEHPNVLKLFGACSITDNPPWFFVCPYYENGNLANYLQRLTRGRDSESPLSPKDLLKMVQEIADGMKYLHMNGIVHGDLKVGGYHR